MDLLSTLFGAGGFLWTAVFFIVALGIIVFVHEYGHYIVGRWTGIHAEVFSLGFGKVLWSGTDRRGTRWQIAAVPLGGFVKFLGDADAASAKDAETMAGLSAEERRHTMHGAPLWARAATVAAGPLFNFILSALVIIGMLLFFGIAKDKVLVGKISAVPQAEQGLQPGDEILAIAGTATPDWESYFTVSNALPAAESVSYSVRRGDVVQEVVSGHPLPPIAGAIQLKSAAFAAGLQEGDVVVEADGRAVFTFAELPAIVEGLGGKPVPLKVWRDDGKGGQILELALTPNRRDIPKAEGGFETRWIMGLNSGSLVEPERRQPGIAEAVGLTLERMWVMVVLSLSSLWHVATGLISSCNISGAISMAQVMGQSATQGIDSYIQMLAMLSLGIGLINLFPIPVLDGGHLVFHAYEAVFRRPPPEAALRVMMAAGLALVLTFMAFALFNDMTCS